MADSQRYKLTLAYRGTRYHGWQRQSGGPPGGEAAADELPTIQNELRMALIRTLAHEVQVTGASRTDAGVHAIGQAAHFDTIRTQIAPQRLLLALNAKLPEDICATAIEPVSDSFDAITDARHKTYRYLIHNAPVKDVFRADLALHIHRRLDVDAMQRAAAHFVGEHDFASFAKPGHGRESTARTISEARIDVRGEDVVIEFSGGGFLWHQVRIMTGTLVHVGLGRRTAGSIPGILEACDRQQAGPTAPAEGLYLLRVQY